MNDFDDFDSDTPPQGGTDDELEAQLVLEAERLAQEDRDGDEYEATRAQQRRDDDQRDADNRRDDMLRDEDLRREDAARAEQEQLARMAELDAEMEFSMDPRPGTESTEDAEGQDITAQAKTRHAEDMAAHREQQAMREADQALRDDQAHNTFYKGGFTDLKGNVVSARDVDAIMANHKAAGGHQAAQERFGLAQDKGSDLATAYYAEKADNPAAAVEQPPVVKVAPGAIDRQANVLHEVDRLNGFGGPGPEDQDLSRRDTEGMDWAKYMGVSDEQAKAVADQVRAEEVRARFLDQEGEVAATSPNLAPLDDQHATVADLSDRLNDPATAEGHAALQEAGTSTDWEARMRESQAEQDRQHEREAQNQSQGMQQVM